ncbi:hypothetical protein [Wolbachia endosymbiont (group A) of Longitarsus flavicornis]|uniref:hypothetical protein n=1 Tax=Wolbachia endosymbiont (group A) of Longitarsus flavicornis TaxID=3066134 RepID=UPI0030CA4108
MHEKAYEELKKREKREALKEREELKKREEREKNKELVLFHVLLAIIGSISGASIGSRLGSITLPLQVVEALFCGSLVGPITFAASNLVLAGRPKKVHEEMLSKFGDGYCGVILFFLSFWATSAAIRVSVGVAANAISPDAVVSGALMLGIIGGLVPVISFLVTNFVTMPVIKKIKECFSLKEENSNSGPCTTNNSDGVSLSSDKECSSSKEENSNSGPCTTNNSDGVSLSSGSNKTSQTEISSIESLESFAVKV